MKTKIFIFLSINILTVQGMFIPSRLKSFKGSAPISSNRGYCTKQSKYKLDEQHKILTKEICDAASSVGLRVVTPLNSLDKSTKVVRTLAANLLFDNYVNYHLAIKDAFSCANKDGICCMMPVVKYFKNSSLETLKNSPITKLKPETIDDIYEDLETYLRNKLLEKLKNNSAIEIEIKVATIQIIYERILQAYKSNNGERLNGFCKELRKIKSELCKN